MFKNYSQTFSAGILSLAGIIVVGLKLAGVEVAEKEIVFALGALANAVGVLWVLFHRFSKGTITPLGKRK